MVLPNIYDTVPEEYCDKFYQQYRYAIHMWVLEEMYGYTYDEAYIDMSHQRGVQESEIIDKYGDGESGRVCRMREKMNTEKKICRRYTFYKLIEGIGRHYF